MWWRKFRQAICWIIGGRDEDECYFAVRSSHPDEVICGDCKHNKWGKVGARI